MTAVEPRVDEPGTGSPDDHAHYARKDDIARAAVSGGSVVALCGVKFEPVRDPSRFPTCPTCERLKRQLGNRSMS